MKILQCIPNFGFVRIPLHCHKAVYADSSLKKFRDTPNGFIYNSIRTMGCCTTTLPSWLSVERVDIDGTYVNTIPLAPADAEDFVGADCEIAGWGQTECKLTYIMVVTCTLHWGELTISLKIWCKKHRDRKQFRFSEILCLNSLICLILLKTLLFTPNIYIRLSSKCARFKVYIPNWNKNFRLYIFIHLKDKNLTKLCKIGNLG